MKKDKIRNYIALFISLTLHLLLLSFNSKFRMRVYEESESKYKVGLVSINSIKTKINEDLEKELSFENMENLEKTIFTNNKEGLEGEEKTPSFHIPFENVEEIKEKIEEKKENFKTIIIENNNKDIKSMEFEKKLEKENLNLKKELLGKEPLNKEFIEIKNNDEFITEKSLNLSKEKSNEDLEEKKDGKEKLENKDENILSISNGEIRVRDNNELVYKIIRMPEANYPSRAKRQKIDESIKVEASFVIGTNGRVKNIELSSNFREFTSLGFAKEVENNLKKYKFSPIYYRGQKVEVLFYKVFIFEMN